MAKYKLIEIKKPSGNVVTGVIKKEDIPTNTVVNIPVDPANTDYQEYLEWVSKGNTAEAAD
tara:strand:- start:95 stop:277 length:183 start_codon:yes stop_codon:yes gene_type:complete